MSLQIMNIWLVLQTRSLSRYSMCARWGEAGLDVAGKCVIQHLWSKRAGNIGCIMTVFVFHAVVILPREPNGTVGNV